MATLLQNDPAAPQPNPPGTTPYTLSDTAAGLLGPNLTNAANSVYAAPNVTPGQASTAVADLFAAQTGAAEDNAQAQAQGIVAQGDQAEAQQYLQAAGVADQNARLARVSANIQSFQENRKILQTVGGQISDIAGANLGGGSGTSGLFLQRDSIQQGALAKALIGVQGEINAGGYEQQSLAAQAEASAANAAAGAASTLATQAASAGSMLTANALNNAMSLVDTAGTGAGATGGGTGSGTGGTGLTTGVFDASGKELTTEQAMAAFASGHVRLDPGTGRQVFVPPTGYNLSGPNTRQNAMDPAFGPWATSGNAIAQTEEFLPQGGGSGTVASFKAS